ncbi:uncharacterized protein LOC135826763 [Sycon ciliatum]|uniref:uncharacterized protein LOC135826763 n=1 Tax=Sycon ciliatum TaxID=27933 RepID=UPI0031F6F160
MAPLTLQPVIAALYRSGSAPEGDTSLMEYLDRTLDAARCHGTQLILAGDFNVHNTDWLHSTKTTNAGEAMEELSAAHHLTQHVLEPTRGNNTLDLVLSDFDTPVVSTVHPPLGRSDHASVITDFLRAPSHREPPTSRCVWRYNLADWPRLKHFFRQTDWSSIIIDNIDLSCERLTGKISEGMATFIPSKSLKLHSTDPLFSKAFHQGRQPSLWKLASVVPVHKKGSKSATKNYRPISLLPKLSKVMEAIINRSLMGFLERQRILTANQYGFRSGLGTQDLLTLLHHRWSTVAAGGGAVRVVAVDIAGAFDQVSHPGVIHKAQQYGVSGMLLAWLRDYLLDRWAAVQPTPHHSRSSAR